MMRRLVVCLLAACITVSAIPAQAQTDPVVIVSGDDAEMNAARDRAVASLPVFWSERDHPKANESDFMLKIRIDGDDQSEHFWCDQIEGDAASATCTIANDPEYVKTVAFGQRIDVQPDHISDWMYMRDGKIVGGETIRALLSHMSKEEADTYRAMLAE